MERSDPSLSSYLASNVGVVGDTEGLEAALSREGRKTSSDRRMKLSADARLSESEVQERQYKVAMQKKIRTRIRTSECRLYFLREGIQFR